jgi:hypothetical protein
LEGISDEVTKFSKGCEHLFAALARRTKFSETEKAMISYYCREIMAQTQALRDEVERKE